VRGTLRRRQPGGPARVVGRAAATAAAASSLAAMRSAFWHVPISVMPARWVSISVCGELGGVRGRELANAYRSMQQDRSVPAYVPRRVQQDCMVREEEGEWEVCRERGLGGGAGKKARVEGRA